MRKHSQYHQFEFMLVSLDDPRLTLPIQGGQPLAIEQKVRVTISSNKGHALLEKITANTNANIQIDGRSIGMAASVKPHQVITIENSHYLIMTRGQALVNPKQSVSYRQKRLQALMDGEGMPATAPKISTEIFTEGHPSIDGIPTISVAPAITIPMNYPGNEHFGEDSPKRRSPLKASLQAGPKKGRNLIRKLNFILFAGFIGVFGYYAFENRLALQRRVQQLVSQYVAQQHQIKLLTDPKNFNIFGPEAPTSGASSTTAANDEDAKTSPVADNVTAKEGKSVTADKPDENGKVVTEKPPVSAASTLKSPTPAATGELPTTSPPSETITAKQLDARPSGKVEEASTKTDLPIHIKTNEREAGQPATQEPEPTTRRPVTAVRQTQREVTVVEPKTVAKDNTTSLATTLPRHPKVSDEKEFEAAPPVATTKKTVEKKAENITKPHHKAIIPMDPVYNEWVHDSIQVYQIKAHYDPDKAAAMLKALADEVQEPALKQEILDALNSVQQMKNSP